MTNKWSIHTAQSSWTNGQRDTIEVIGRRRPYPTPDRCEMKCWSNGHAAISRVFCSSRLQHLALLGCSSLPTARGRSFIIVIIISPTGLVCSLQRSKDQGEQSVQPGRMDPGSNACRYSTGDANGSLRSRQDLLFILVLMLSNNPLALIVGQSSGSGSGTNRYPHRPAGHLSGLYSIRSRGSSGIAALIGHGGRWMLACNRRPLSEPSSPQSHNSTPTASHQL